jgi:hypothetical protein
MARVFVSHSGKDAALAGEVHRWLVDDGHESFLDQDLYDGIRVGDQWEQRLHERLRWADAMVCVLTSAYLASVWCTAELAIAQSRGSRVLPVRAEPEVDHPLLTSLQQVDMTRDAARPGHDWPQSCCEWTRREGWGGRMTAPRSLACAR